MRILSGIVSATLLMPALALAEEAKEQQIHDKPAVRGSIIANLLQEHDNPFTLYPYDPITCCTPTPAISTKRPSRRTTGPTRRARTR